MIAHLDNRIETMRPAFGFLMLDGTQHRVLQMETEMGDGVLRKIGVGTHRLHGRLEAVVRTTRSGEELCMGASGKRNKLD
jgi:hypothetical protein